MTLELITTSGAEDANAYSALAVALNVAATRGNQGKLFVDTLSEQQQFAAIITWAQKIDALDFDSARLNGETQAMKFPRLKWPVIPRDIINANALAAVLGAAAFTDAATVVDYAPELDANGNVKKEKIGPIETEFVKATDAGSYSLFGFPDEVAKMLKPYLRENALIEAQGGVWSSGSASRAT